MSVPHFTRWFSLTARDLAQQSARRRTYVLRTLCAAALFVCFLALVAHRIWQRSGPMGGVIGSGGEIFEFLVAAQFAGIFVILPGLMSSAITYEKEQGSLELLLLTNLSPWQILLQKYVSRLVPVFSILLLSLPLLALAYSLGGVTMDHVYAAVFYLVLTSLQVGALALMCSAFCHRTGEAFLCTYLLGAGFYLLAPWVWFLILSFDTLVARGREIVQGFFPPLTFLRFQSAGWTGKVMIQTGWIIATTILFLGLARFFLVRRAVRRRAVRRRASRVRWWRRATARWQRWAEHSGGPRDDSEVQVSPEEWPLAWRDRLRTPFGRICLALPLLTLLLAALTGGVVAVVLLLDEPMTGIVVIKYLLWHLAVLLVARKATDAFALERSQQTLEVLLTVPLGGMQLVHQKFRPVRGLICLFLAPLLTVLLFEGAWFSVSGMGWTASEHLAIAACLGWAFALLSALALGPMAVFLLLFGWIGVWVGLKVHSRPRAIVTSLIVVMLCNAVLLVIPGLFTLQTLLYPDGVGRGELFLALLYAIAVLFIYRYIVCPIRERCLLYADRYLGRGRRRRGQHRQWPWRVPQA